MNQQSLPCPDCGTQIVFDTMLLLQGKRFVCPNCKLAIALPNDSHDLVQNTMKKFDDLKKDINK